MHEDSQGQSGTLYKPHPHPIWQDRADTLIVANVEHDGPRKIKEQLCARQLSKQHFEICCIPFFTYGLALGDEVATRADEEDEFVLDRIIRRSGNRTFWIWFYPPATDAVRLEVRDTIVGFGCDIEWCYSDLLAFNVSADLKPQPILDALRKAIRQRYLDVTSSEIS